MRQPELNARQKRLGLLLFLVALAGMSILFGASISPSLADLTMPAWFLVGSGITGGWAVEISDVLRQEDRQ